MGTPDSRNPFGMLGYRKPVVNGRPDLAALDRRLTRPVVPRHQQQHPVPRRHCPVQRSVEGIIGRRKAMAVKVERAIDRHAAVLEPPLPMAV